METKKATAEPIAPKEKKDRVCENCGKPLGTGKKRKYCSEKCKRESYRKRKNNLVVLLEVHLERKPGFFRRLINYIF